MRAFLRRRSLTAFAGLALFAGSFAGNAAAQFIKPVPLVYSKSWDRVCDPKLVGGGAEAAFYYGGSAGTSIKARIDIDGPGGYIKTLWTGYLPGGGPTNAITVLWDGRDAAGDYVVTGDYKFVVRNAAGTASWTSRRVTVVRLGIVEMEFQDSVAGSDEWQMVYFKKNGIAGAFYSTPSIGEYDNRSAASVSNLDLDNGDPRPPVGLHTATDEPVMNGVFYATEGYNYPLAYTAGAAPQVQVTLGDGGTTVGGAAMGSAYPVAGVDIRLVGTLPSGYQFQSAAISPGTSVLLSTEALTNEVQRTDWDIVWSFEYAYTTGTSWRPILGTHTTEHRFYTIWSDPIFPAVGGGTKYDGPWVEVADYVASWCETLGVTTVGDLGLIENFVRGFFGGQAPFGAPIEGVFYDSPGNGGGTGSPHYWSPFTDILDLSGLLDGAANDVFVNCDDNATTASTMLSMMGLHNMQTVRVGEMWLNAIWGIGAPGYTTELWGPMNDHWFFYHRFASRDSGVNVIDTCLQVDEDGMPGSTPGFPGWNIDRDWAGANGYDQLSSTNAVAITNVYNLVEFE